MVETNNIGTSELDTGDAFLLSSPDILAVQRYVTSGVNLPIDMDSLNKLLIQEYPKENEKDLDNLFATYNDVKEHCTYWRDHTFPSMVGCASDIVNYNEKVPIYYGELNRLLPQLEQHNPGDEVINKYTAIITVLSTTAKGYADHATLVKTEMTDFANKCKTDNLHLADTQRFYENMFGADSNQVTTLMKQIKDDYAMLKKLQEDYEHDVVVAATSPTYCWVFPIGTIAAVTVASIYGSRATSEQTQIRNMMDTIQTQQGKLKMYTDILTDLNVIESGLGDIQSQLNAALPIIEKIQGAWNAISSDLDQIRKIIDEDIDKVPAIIKDLGIEEAINAWGKLAKIADNYRSNAFITVNNVKLEDLSNIHLDVVPLDSVKFGI